jgi:hypothetical protein
LSEKSREGADEPVVEGGGSFFNIGHFVFYRVGTGDGFEVVGEEEGFFGFIVFEQVMPRNGGGGSFGTDTGGLIGGGGTH